jgi:cellulose synthase/poly-beta-1,6-N-acetylglucosamine synthase-like glycosyltransferase
MDQFHFISLIFFAALLIQSYFYFRYFIPLVFQKNKTSTANCKAEAVSVIICAHNELENLKQNLSLFLIQEFEDYEVILVNDRSEDGSQEWLNKQRENYPNLKVITIEETPENFNPKKYALTKGIYTAKNEIILLSDADCQPGSLHWVDKMARSFSKSISIVLGASLYQKRKGFLNQFIRFETLQTALLYLSFAYKKEAYMGVGRNLAYRKSFFIDHDGFKDLSPLMGGDDDLWVNRHATKENTRICMHPESLTFSNPKEKWSSFFRQKKRHLSVGKYYKQSDKMKLGLFHASQTLLWIFFILGIVLGSPTDCLILSSLILIHLLGQYVAFYKLSINFGIRFEQHKLLVLEALFIFYYWIWGTYASLTKHLKWK